MSASNMGMAVYGRLSAIQYREATMYQGAIPQGIDVLRVHFVAPDGEEYHHDVPNSGWTVENEGLQFLANWGYKPSDVEGDSTVALRDCNDDKILLLVIDQGDDYALAQGAFEGAKQALQDAVWFDGADDTDDGGPDQQMPPGGGGDGGGGGQVNIEVADEDSDAGINVDATT